MFHLAFVFLLVTNFCTSVCSLFEPPIALSFALRKSKEVRQKLVNAKSTEELEQKLDEIADALAITDSKMNAIFSMLLFISKKL